MYKEVSIPDVYTIYLLGTIREVDTAIYNKVVCLKQYTYDAGRRTIVYLSWEDGKQIMRHDIYLIPDIENAHQAYGIEYDEIVVGGTAVLHKNYRAVIEHLRFHKRKDGVDTT